MLVFPNCKINLGLHVINKRPDGYHNIETVFYPLQWCDALEVIENRQNGQAFEFSSSGLSIAGSPADNLIYKAWQLIAATKKCPPIRVHLHKNIPMGAGLGGGSADAAFFINALDQLAELGMSPAEKINIARQLGSDCAFFINNTPVFAQGRGDEFTDLPLDLSAYYLLAVYPNVHSNTADAYAGLSPKQPGVDLPNFLQQAYPAQWKAQLVNDFEPSIFKKYPQVEQAKAQLYQAGALYACMSGSGSAVFGIFEKEPVLSFPANYQHCLQKPSAKIL